MKKLLILSLSLFCSFWMFAQTVGALIQPPSLNGAVDFKMKVASQLGITCLREAVVLGDNEVPKIFSTSCSIVLNVNTGKPGWTGAVAYTKDTATYRKDLQAQINLLPRKAALLVIENEETNPNYHKGSISDYINELKVGVDVAHRNRMPATNGGLTRNGVLYCMYQDMLAQGRSQEAKDFASRTKLAVRSSRVQSQGAMVQQLLSAFKLIAIDGVNLHFYADQPADALLMEEMSSFITGKTGKPVLSNEAGQSDWTPETVTAMLRSAQHIGASFFIWYSGKGDGGHAEPLHKTDATLYSNGIAFKNFIAGERTGLQ